MRIPIAQDLTERLTQAEVDDIRNDANSILFDVSYVRELRRRADATLRLVAEYERLKLRVWLLENGDAKLHTR